MVGDGQGFTTGPTAPATAVVPWLRGKLGHGITRPSRHLPLRLTSAIARQAERWARASGQ